jgi:hypothetical protein
MAPKGGAQGVVGTAIFALDGSGMAPNERWLWRRVAPAWMLASALTEEPQFSVHVAAVRVGPAVTEAWRLAGNYATGRRRATIARLLLAAAADRRNRAFQQLYATAAGRVGGDDETYVMGPSFSVPLLEGARLIARSGGGMCLMTGEGAEHWCGSARAAPSAYCRRHDRTVSPETRAAHKYCMRHMFELATPGILEGVWLHPALECGLRHERARSAKRSTAHPSPRR